MLRIMLGVKEDIKEKQTVIVLKKLIVYLGRQDTYQ